MVFEPPQPAGGGNCFFFFTDSSCAVGYREIFDVVHNNGMDFDHGREKILSFLINKYPNLEESLQESEGLSIKIQNFLRTLKRYWKECDYSFSKFLNKRETWLARQLTVDDSNTPSTSGLPHGRPKKSFDNASRTSRKRKISDVVESHSLEELVATEKNYKE